MKVVADKLREWAIHEHNDNNADAFGRSAFNRYYYSSYLITREMLKKLNPKWARAGHGTIPKVLKESVTKKARQEIKRAERGSLINLQTSSSLRHSLNIAVAELSSLLSLAYSVRITADYEPECRVFRAGGSIKLNDQSLEAAKSWPDKAAAFSKTILRVWSDLGIS
jgi:hypothetical protein